MIFLKKGTFEFKWITRKSYSCNERQAEISVRKMANGETKTVYADFVDVDLTISLGLLDTENIKETYDNLENGEYEYYSPNSNSMKKANFKVTKSPLVAYHRTGVVYFDPLVISLKKTSEVD